MQSRFLVALRGPSAALFSIGEQMQIEGLPSSVGLISATYRTRWNQNSSGVLIPGHLWVEAIGSGDDLGPAISKIANAALPVLVAIAVTTNAAVSDPEIELAFDVTPTKTRRAYFQSYVAPEQPQLLHSRRVPITQTLSFLRALLASAERERLSRAADQYRLALDSWKLGRETICVAHLWMAIEALTKVFVRRECGVGKHPNEAALAKGLGVDLRLLDATIRRDVILQGDTECYAAAKKTSDGFEHGFLDVDELRSNAVVVRARLAQLVRSAILVATEVNADDISILESDPYANPIGNWPLAKYFRASLVGPGERLAKPGNEYPFLRWTPTIKSCELTSHLQVELSETIAAELGDGIQFTDLSVEMWRPD